MDEYDNAEDVVMPAFIDHFDKYLGNVVMVNLSTGSRPITGMLIEIDDVWITLQKHDGDEVDIKKKAVYAIGQVKAREGYDREVIRPEVRGFHQESDERSGDSVYDALGRYVRS